MSPQRNIIALPFGKPYQRHQKWFSTPQGRQILIHQVWLRISETALIKKIIWNLIKFHSHLLNLDCVSIGSIDSTLARTTSTKLDPMIMLSVMHRKGLNRMKNVNRRISIPSATTSPARVNNNNIMSMSPFNSTMITGEEPPINAHLFTLSPWREGSF